MSRKLLAATFAVGAGVVVLFLRLEPEAIYSFGVTQFLARNERGREVRVTGRLVGGSLCRVEAECGFRFAITDDGWDGQALPNVEHYPPTLSIAYDACALPDTFRDVENYPITVTVQGERCQTCHDFQATQVIAKCPAKYEFPSDAGVPVARPLRSCNAAKPRM